MEITGREVRAIGWMFIKHLPAELLQELCWPSSRVYVAIDLTQLTMNFDRRHVSWIQNLYHWSHLTVGECWNMSLHLQPLQRCYCGDSGSPASICVMWYHSSITCMQSLHAISGLLAVGRLGNLLCGRPSYIALCLSFPGGQPVTQIHDILFFHCKNEIRKLVQMFFSAVVIDLLHAVCCIL